MFDVCDCFCQCGEIALLSAVEKENAAVVQLLLNYGANVNYRDNVDVVAFQFQKMIPKQRQTTGIENYYCFNPLCLSMILLIFLFRLS